MTQTNVLPPTLVAYYLDAGNQLVVVEVVNAARQVQGAPRPRNWRKLLDFTPDNASGAHTDPAASIEVGGRAAKALYVMCEGPDKMRLVATESLAGVKRMVKPPKPVAATRSTCNCALVRCGPSGRLCCPCP